MFMLTVTNPGMVLQMIQPQGSQENCGELNGRNKVSFPSLSVMNAPSMSSI